jgi:hypothetical protein
MNSADRIAVSRASDGIDRRSALDPLNDGESRDASRRVLFELPLAVQYSVNEQDRIAYVTLLWQPRKRSQL